MTHCTRNSHTFIWLREHGYKSIRSLYRTHTLTPLALEWRKRILSILSSVHSYVRTRAGKQPIRIQIGLQLHYCSTETKEARLSRQAQMKIKTRHKHNDTCVIESKTYLYFPTESRFPFGSTTDFNVTYTRAHTHTRGDMSIICCFEQFNEFGCCVRASFYTKTNITSHHITSYHIIPECKNFLSIAHKTLFSSCYR